VIADLEAKRAACVRYGTELQDERANAAAAFHPTDRDRMSRSKRRDRGDGHCRPELSRNSNPSCSGSLSGDTVMPMTRNWNE
jgi:hypothetical protein